MTNVKTDLMFYVELDISRAFCKLGPAQFEGRVLHLTDEFLSFKRNSKEAAIFELPTPLVYAVYPGG